MFKLNRLIYFLFLPVVPVLFPSCTTFDPPVTTPAYGHIDSIHFFVPADSAAVLGSASSNIHYAWVYLDDNPVGAFQMPCTFPMVAGNGTHNIEIFSGIDPVDGSTALSINPFYQYYSVNVTLQQGVTTVFHPTSTYYTWVKFPYMQDFESVPAGSEAPNLTKYTGDLGASDTIMIATSTKALVYQGAQSGMAVVDSKNHFFNGVTSSLTLPTTGQPVYLELNYKCTTYFSIYVFEGSESSQIASNVVYPSSTWKKLYVSLNGIIQTYTIQPFNISFVMARDTITPHSKDTLLLDNIKVDD